jgi:hypothetical protein
MPRWYAYSRMRPGCADVLSGRTMFCSIQRASCKRGGGSHVRKAAVRAINIVVER